MQGAAPIPKGARPDAATLAEMGALRRPTEPAAASSAAVDPDEAAAAAEPDPPAKDGEEAPVDPIADTPDAEPDKPAEASPAPDPAEARGLASVRKAEERMRRQVAEERKAIAAEHKKALADLAAEREAFKKEHSASLEEARAFAALKARARQDPDAILAALGLDETDADLAMRALYPRTKAGKEDPNARANTARAMADRARADEVAAAKKEAADARAEAAAVRKLIEDRDAASRAEKAANEWLDAAQKATTSADAPIVTRWLEKNPARARQRIGEVAMEMLDRDGVVPDHAEVIAEVESRRRAEMEADGYDIAAYVGKAPVAKPPPAPPPKTLAQAGAAPAAAKKKQSDDEMRAEFRRKAATGAFGE